MLIDVRPAEEYAAGHIDGARSIPIDELEQRLAELPADREVVAYCRGPFCAYAHDAVRRLQAAGRPARRLRDGWPEWRLADNARRTAPSRLSNWRRGMRAIECPCGHHLEAADDAKLFGLCREHMTEHHPDWQRTDDKIRERVAADASEAEVVA